MPGGGSDYPGIVRDLSALVEGGCKFPTIYADPPWQYRNRSSRAAAENHYPTLSLKEICAEPVPQLAADNAHLHLWTTNAFLADAFRVVRAWGFTYKSCFVWVKDRMGMGNYWRVSHEFLCDGSHKNSYVVLPLMWRWGCLLRFWWVESFSGPHNDWSIPVPFSLGGSTMFERLYKRGATLARHQDGPLAVERERFLRYLADDQQQHKCQLVIAANYLLIVAEWLRLAERDGELIGQEEIEEQAVQQSPPLVKRTSLR
jgi:hypothetical protein